MRSVLLPLIIFMLTTGYAVAENQEKAQSPEVKKPAEGFNQKKVVKLRGGKFSRMFLTIVSQSRGLNLTDEQREEVMEISRKYSQTMIEEENKSRQLQKKFVTLLQDGELDASELKVIAKDTEKANTQAAYSFIDGVSEIEKAIGPENFARLNAFKRVDRNALIKLREQNTKKAMERRKTAQQAPEKEATKDDALKSE